MNIPRVLQYFKNNGLPTDIYSNNNQFLGIWSTPKAIFENIAKYIRNAKYEVNITFYNWYTDTDVAKILCEALQVAIFNFKATSKHPKFNIRFMFSEHITQKGYILEELKKAIHLYDLNINSTIYIHVKTYYSLGSYHFKYITIDGEYVLVTGANVQNRFNFSEASIEPDDNWSDTGIIFRGDITTLVNKHFSSCTGFKIETQQFNFEKLPVLLLTNSSNGYIHNSYERLYLYYHKPLNVAIFLTILWCVDELILISPNFEDGLIFYALLDKLISDKIIKIKILTNYNFNYFVQEHFQNGINSKFLYNLIYFNTITYNAYLEGRLQIKWFSKDGIKAINKREKYANHAKAIFADNHISILGSYNLTTQSSLHSGELSVLIESEELAKQIKGEIFEKNWELAIPFKFE